jgi:phosphatidylinositol-3-phosphatase
MRGPLFPLILVAIILVSSTLADTSLSVSDSIVITSTLPLWFEHVVIIMMENHGINATYGSQCMGNCTYFDYLANSTSLAEDYTNNHVPGSLGDYIALTSGDGSVTCNTAPGSCGPFNEANIVDRIEGSGLTWKAYMEDYPPPCVPGVGSCSSGGCFTGDGPGPPGYYSVVHDPFVYYQDILNSTRRCSNIMPANSAPNPAQACGTPIPIAETDNLFLSSLNSPSSAANYTFLTPNSIDDVHDCGNGTIGNVTIGNLYLQQLIPQVLNSAVFTTTRSALFVTFDEPDPYRGPSGVTDLYTVWASHNSAHTQGPGYRSVRVYSHFSFLRTVENNWGFKPFFASKNDGIATDMGEFLRSF